MPAAARGKFFFSISFQISRIFLRMLFVALASFSYVSSPPGPCAGENTRPPKGRPDETSRSTGSVSFTICLGQLCRNS